MTLKYDLYKKIESGWECAIADAFAWGSHILSKLITS
jgi:hypothetical protein